jgi:AbrB family looped-hinge helix DNA binding protein
MGSELDDISMEAVVDQAGRIVLPKFIRDALGLLPGTKVDISPYGAGDVLFGPIDARINIMQK